MTDEKKELMKSLQFYTTKEVADILSLTQRSLYKFIDSGELRAMKLGSWRISESDLQAFIDSREKNYTK